MSLNEKLQSAYNKLMDSVLFSLKQAEDTSLHWLGENLTKLESRGTTLEVLTEHELEEVQQLIKADIEQTAGFFDDIEQGWQAFLNNDWVAIESVLTEKTLSLADPSQIQHLKIRLQAALDNN
jgi:hypothetical protein